jgi:chaperonin GroES
MIRVLGPRVLVERLPDPSSPSGLIEVVVLEQEPSQWGRVVAVGSGTRRQDGTFIPVSEVAVGDRVLLKKYTGGEIIVEGRPYAIAMIDDLLGVVEDT